MRWATVLGVCALAAPAAADPPSEGLARAAASDWMRAAAEGDADELARRSAVPVVVSIDAGLRCPIDARARTRRDVARVARTLKKCVFRIAADQWHALDPKGDTRTVSFSTMDETFYVFGVTVDADGAVRSVTMRTSYGGY